MKIVFIVPCEHTNEWKNSRSVFVFPPLAFAFLKAMTPPQHEVIIIDETYEEIKITPDIDLIGISIITATANRGYYLADKYRQQGIPVVIGGIHASLCPDEVSEHADAVVVGEGESVWQTLLIDLENNRLKKRYDAPLVDLDSISIPDHSILKTHMYRIPNTVMATRGCPFQCSFCATSFIFGKKYRTRSIPDVVQEIRQFKKRFFIFLDDNLFFKRKYALELMQAITPLKKRWVAQADFTVSEDENLLHAMKKAGCMALLLGFESVSKKNFHEMGKPVKNINDYKQAIEKIHKAGILIQGSFIFGFDGDTKEIFHDTLEFVKEVNIDTANFCVLTPIPGTPVFKKLDDDNRILTKNWSKYTRQLITFQPLNMTPAELARGRLDTYKKYYSLRSMLRRMPFHFPHFLWFWLYNISFRIGIHKASKHDNILYQDVESLLEKNETQPV